MESGPRRADFLIGVPLCFVVTYAVLFSHRQPQQAAIALLTMLAGFSCVCALALFLKKRAFQAGWAELRLKRFGTADLDAIRQLAEDYAKLCEARDAAQASVNAKSAAADTLYNSLSSNEQGILLEVRRFAPAAFDIPTADQLLRGCAVRRKELAEAETAAREARMRYELQVEQAPAPRHAGGGCPRPVRSREAISTELDRVRAALAGGPLLRGPSGRPAPRRGRSRGAAGLCRGPGCPKGAAGNGVQRLRLAMEALEGANTALQNRFSPALGRRAAGDFSRLTDNRYAGVVLDRSFRPRQSLWETRCSGMPPCSPPARWTSCIWRCAWRSVSWCCRRRSRCPSVITATGIQLMTVNLLLEHETDPVIWRGPVIGGVVQQFWGDVLWQDVDYMFVDMPPGTGDVALNVFQSLPVDGVIIVASPPRRPRATTSRAASIRAIFSPTPIRRRSRCSSPRSGSVPRTRSLSSTTSWPTAKPCGACAIS